MIQRHTTGKLFKGEIAMVKILAGEKGEGKTKRMIDMANAAGKEAKGNIVFVDDDNSHMYDLHYSVRFVETPKFIMEDPQVFRGFVCGILSQNSDIETIYIDGLNHIMDRISDADFTAFIQELDKTSKEAEMDMVMIISRKTDALPAEVQQYLI
jgi:hypothetical protein